MFQCPLEGQQWIRKNDFISGVARNGAMTHLHISDLSSGIVSQLTPLDADGPRSILGKQI